MAHDLKHHHLTWRIDNVHLWGEVLQTVVNGPDFSHAGCPWMLKLGQSSNPRSNGIVLFIERLDRFERVTANVRVTAHKDNDNLNPLLLENFRVTFTRDFDVWESPVLCTNLAFKREASSTVMSRIWDFKVQLIWQEILTYPPSNDMAFLRQEKVGTDLEAFINNEKYSDIYIRCDGGIKEYVPAHKAILSVRSRYLSRNIDSYPNSDWMDINEDLFPTKNSTAIDTLLKFCYTGNVKYVAENNPIPIEVFDCAREMEMQELETYTQPYHFGAQTLIKTETVTYEWAIKAFNFRRSIQEPVTVKSETFGKPDKEQFTIGVTISPTKKDSPRRIDVFLRFETESGLRICVIADFTVKNCEGNTILNKRSANHDMAPNDSLLCISNLEINEEHMKTNSEHENLIFSCEIEYSKNETKAYITRIPVVKSVYHSDVDPIRRHCKKVYHRWISDFVGDLGMLVLNEMHSDCTIAVGDDRLPAHRVILEARSPYFFNYVHSVNNVGLVYHPMEYHIKKDFRISTQVMIIILQEIYTGSAHIKGELSQEIHAAAIAFGLDELAAVSKDHYEVYSLGHKFKDIAIP